MGQRPPHPASPTPTNDPPPRSLLPAEVSPGTFTSLLCLLPFQAHPEWVTLAVSPSVHLLHPLSSSLTSLASSPPALPSGHVSTLAGMPSLALGTFQPSFLAPHPSQDVLWVFLLFSSSPPLASLVGNLGSSLQCWHHPSPGRLLSGCPCLSHLSTSAVTPSLSPSLGCSPEQLTCPSDNSDSAWSNGTPCLHSPPTGASFWMPSLGEGCFFTSSPCGEYPGIGFLSTSKSCQSVCHTPQGSTYLPPQPVKATITSHWGDGSHHSPCPIPLSPFASFKSILKSSSQSEVLKTQTGSCQWPPPLSLPVAVTPPLPTVNSKLSLKGSNTKNASIPPLVHCPHCPPCPFSPCYTHPNALRFPATALVLVSPGRAVSGCFHCSACSCLHPYNQASQVFHHCGPVFI